jgi:Kef-type K+ transport system membrane component KefB
MAVAWLLGSLSAFAGLPSLVGEIVAGFLLGPPLADFVPYPGALVLLGNIGLIGLLLESGISLDLPQLKINGHRALLMATAGAVIPLAVGFSVGRWIGQDVPSAIAAGACFASTSLGVASNALNTGDVINTPLGQLIVASSVLDDVYGLIMLSLLQVIGDPDSQAFDYVLPFLSSFVCLIGLGALGLTVFPRIIEEKILPLAPEGVRDQVAMVLVLMFVTAYMLLLNESKASYLTGVFLAGLTFCKIRSVHAFFVKYARPIHVWLLRVFFSATIGFQVPITQFHKPYVLKWGFAFRK